MVGYIRVLGTGVLFWIRGASWLPFVHYSIRLIRSAHTDFRVNIMDAWWKKNLR